MRNGLTARLRQAEALGFERRPRRNLGIAWSGMVRPVLVHLSTFLSTAGSQRATHSSSRRMLGYEQQSSKTWQARERRFQFVQGSESGIAFRPSNADATQPHTMKRAKGRYCCSTSMARSGSNNQHQRWEPAALGSRVGTDLNGWLSSAACCSYM